MGLVKGQALPPVRSMVEKSTGRSGIKVIPTSGVSSEGTCIGGLETACGFTSLRMEAGSWVDGRAVTELGGPCRTGLDAAIDDVVAVSLLS